MSYLFEQSVEHLEQAPPRGKRKSAPAAATELIMTELREVERQLSDITEALGDGSLAVAVAAPAAKSLEDRRRTLIEQLARALPPPALALGLTVVKLEEGIFVTDQPKFLGPQSAVDFMGRWERRELSGTEVESLRATLEASIERVSVSPRGRRGRTFDPSRVKIAWR